MSHINGSPREESHRNHALTLLHRPLLSVSPHAVHVQEEDIRLMKVMFDFYDRDRDGSSPPARPASFAREPTKHTSFADFELKYNTPAPVKPEALEKKTVWENKKV